VKQSIVTELQWRERHYYQGGVVISRKADAKYQTKSSDDIECTQVFVNSDAKLLLTIALRFFSQERDYASNKNTSFDAPAQAKGWVRVIVRRIPISTPKRPNGTDNNFNDSNFYGLVPEE